ncbi:MAG: hypothetical protein Tsb0018_11360 [Opitutales bacterium]
MSDNHNIEPPHRREASRETMERAGYKDEAMQEIHTQLMREKEEPREGFSPIPVFMVFIFGALMFWGGIYIANHSGNFRGDVFNPNFKPGAIDAENVTKAAFDPLKQGTKLFKRQCQQCHQADGMGIAGVYPPLVGSEWVAGSDVRLIKILLLGMSGPITVKGEVYNNNMPAVGMWKDKDIASVLTYIRASWGNDAPPVEEELVAQVRAELGGRKNAWTPEELLKLHPME